MKVYGQDATKKLLDLVGNFAEIWVVVTPAGRIRGEWYEQNIVGVFLDEKEARAVAKKRKNREIALVYAYAVTLEEVKEEQKRRDRLDRLRCG